MFDMSKKYTTRDGREVRVLTKDMKNRDGFNVVGIVVRPDGTEFAMEWKEDGTCWNSGSLEAQWSNKQLDLVPVPTMHTGWGVIFSDIKFSFNVFLTREDAERFFHDDERTGRVVPVTWEE